MLGMYAEKIGVVGVSHATPKFALLASQRELQDRMLHQRSLNVWRWRAVQATWAAPRLPAVGLR